MILLYVFLAIIFFYLINIPIFLISILGGGIVFIWIIVAILPLTKYLFTSLKIVIRSRKRVGFTLYSNISSISYDNTKNYQDITITLKKPLQSEHFCDMTVLEIHALKNLYIFKNLNYLRKQILNVL